MPVASITDSTIKAVRSVNFLDILESEGIVFKKNGREAVTLCPWHNDKRPSLTVNPARNFCFCFVCQIGQDNIGFLRQHLSLSFSDTVLRIAQKHNIEVLYDNIDPEQAAKEAAKRAYIKKKLEDEQQLYRDNLRSDSGIEARKYIDERKIKPETSKFFGLGYSINGFFKERLTIPVHDHIGNIVGFTARGLYNWVMPKYKNSASSETFDKSAILYNENRATRSIRENDSVIFVEGHLDVISMHQAGHKNVVAMQGTAAPSLSILNRLTRLTTRFILCYDGDPGGRKATEAFLSVAGRLSLTGKISINICDLNSKDPDEYIQEYGNLHQVIENASPWLDYLIDKWLTVSKSDTARFTEAERKTKELINSIQSPALRQHYINKVSIALADNKKDASELAKSFVNITKRPVGQWTPMVPQQIRKTAERRLLRIYLHFVMIRADVRDLMDEIESPIYAWAWARIREIEDHTNAELVIDVFCAVLVVAEPHYLKQLRPLLRPTVSLSGQLETVDYIRSQITSNKLKFNGQSQDDHALN